MLNQFSEILKLLLQIANITIIGYGLYKFLNKPHDTLEEQVRAIEKRVDRNDLKLLEIEKSLDSSHEKHRNQKEINTVFINCMLAFIDFEIAFCQHTNYEHTEDLVKAKQTLQEYLSNK